MADYGSTNKPATKGKGMELSELAALVGAQIEAAAENDRTSWAKDRTRHLEYYLGEMKDTPAQPNSSKATSRDVADTIDWMMPGLMRVFLASDKVVEYQARGREDEAGARQATEYVNYKFLVDSHGYDVLYDAFHCGLLMRQGVVKFYWDQTPEFRTWKGHRLTDAEVEAQMTPQPVADPKLQPFPIEVVEEEDVEPDEGEAEAAASDWDVPQMQMQMDPMGQPMPAPPLRLRNVTFKQQVNKGHLCIVSVAPEEYLTDSGATCVEDAVFHCHKTVRTRADLVEEGYDKDQVYELPADTRRKDDTPEAISRTDEFDSSGDSNKLHPSMEKITVYETYLRVDYDGDGKAEWVRCVMAGGTSEKNILSYDGEDAVEEWEDPIPFAVFVPTRIPHRWQGRSIADQTADIQQIKTVLLRGALDNVYSVNNPQRVIIQSEIVSPDELTNPTRGGFVRVKSNVGAVQPLPVPYIADGAFKAMAFMDEVTTRRTGVSSASMALDPETLQNQTATATQLQHDSSYSKIELIARNFAEGGMRTLFSGILKLYVKYQDRPETVRLRNTFVDMDPRWWNAEMDVSIDVGLGAGSRDRDMAMLTQMLGMQKEIVAQLGIANPMCGLPEIYNTLSKLVETAGLRNPDQYFKAVTPEQAQQLAQAQANKPDPKTQALVQKAQADMQIGQAKAKSDAQMSQQKMQAELQIKQAESAAQLQLAREEMAARMELEQHKAQMEHDLRIVEMEKETQLKAMAIQSRVNLPGAEDNIQRPQ